MNIYSPKEMTSLLERHDFFFKKNLGQNFLIQKEASRRIALAARDTLPEDEKTLAVEIGPGAGSLTLQLADLFDRVLALEIDPHLMGVLEESLAGLDNVKVINTDALTFDFTEIARLYPDHRIAVCSNLPYYITSEIIMRLLESRLPIVSMTLLIQKEAAQRLCAKPGEANYGAITASTSNYAKAERLFSLGPGNFIPRPKVDSTVLRLTPYSVPPVSVSDRNLFFRLIRAAFASRRKTLSNSLFLLLKDRVTKEELSEYLQAAGIDPARRGETLTLQEYAAITDIFSKSEEC